MSSIPSQVAVLHSEYARKAAENRAIAAEQLTPGTVRVLRLPGVEVLTGLKKTSIYNLMRDEDFPRPVSLSARAKGWVETEVIAWLENRIQQREVD